MQNHEKMINPDKTPVMGLPEKDYSLPVVTEIVDSDITRVLMEPASSRSYFLEYEDEGQAIPVTEFPFTIGRSESSDLHLKEKTVSRVHAILKSDNHMVIIENLGGLNGVFVNGHSIKRVILIPGDKISLGGVSLVFHATQGNGSHGSGVVRESRTIRNLVPIVSTVISQPEDRVTAEASSEVDTLSDITDIEPVGTGRMKHVVWILLVVLAGAAGSIWYYQKRVDDRVFVLSSRDAENKSSKASTDDQEDRAGSQTNNPVKQQKKAISAVSGSQMKASNKLMMPATQQSSAQNHPSENPAVVPVKTTRQLILFEERKSRQLLEEAKALYLKGDEGSADDILQEMMRNTGHRAEYRQQAAELDKKLASLYASYSQGKQYFANSNKDGAFQSWIEMLKNERLIFSDLRSIYSQRVMDIVVREYEKRGNEAYAQDRPVDAYRNWKAAVQINPTSKARKSMEMMDADLQEIYRNGYRYETVDIRKAIKYWREVTEKAPAEHEYYIKAMAKLRWYEHLEKE